MSGTDVGYCTTRWSAEIGRGRADMRWLSCYAYPTRMLSRGVQCSHAVYNVKSRGDIAELHSATSSLICAVIHHRSYVFLIAYMSATIAFLSRLSLTCLPYRLYVSLSLKCLRSYVSLHRLYVSLHRLYVSLSLICRARPGGVRRREQGERRRLLCGLQGRGAYPAYAQSIPRMHRAYRVCTERFCCFPTRLRSPTHGARR
eukprot:3930278-Rhodomonas_salina.1